MMSAKFNKYAMARTLTEGIRYCENHPLKTDNGEDVLPKTPGITPAIIDRKVKGSKQDAKLSPIPTKNNAEPASVVTGTMKAPKGVIESVLGDMDEGFDFGDKSKIPGSHSSNSPKQRKTVKDMIKHAGLDKGKKAPVKPNQADDDEEWVKKNVSVDQTLVPGTEASKRVYNVANRLARK